MRFQKQISSAVQRCYFTVELRVVFTTGQFLPSTKKDVLSSHQCSNLVYQYVCHCDSQCVGRTSQRLQEGIMQHIPKFTAISPNRKSLPRRCKANGRSRQFHESAIGQHLDNPTCASHYDDDKFSILDRDRFLFYLSALGATFIKFLKPILCKQQEFVYFLKMSSFLRSFYILSF